MLKRIVFVLSLTALLGCSDKGRYQFTIASSNVGGAEGVGSGVLLDSTTGRIWQVMITPRKVQISESAIPALPPKTAEEYLNPAK